MNLSVLLIFIILFQIGKPAYGQNVPSAKITLSEKNATLNKVFKDLAKKSKYQFFYQNELLAKLDKISFSVQNATLDQVLAVCLKDQPLTYSIVGATVVIKKKELPPPPEKSVSASALIDVTIRVVDEQGQPLPNATVQVKNGKEQVGITDDKGFFTLNRVETNAIIVITIIGYDRKEVSVFPSLGYIRMTLATSKLDEVKVIAYGTTSQRLNTGDVSSVSAKEIGEQPVDNPLLALEGRVPGMVISETNGLPGAQVEVNIRGINSLQNGTDPLYIIDGVPYSTSNPFQTSGVNVLGTGNSDEHGVNPFSFINPADIASVEVLKDADATAIYGSRGANGVVLITTKKGKVGDTKLDVNIQNGFGKVGHKLKVLNTQQYLEMRNEAFKNDGTVPNPNADYDMTLWDTTRNTDWQKELIGGTSHNSNDQVTISGGNSDIQYLVGAGYSYEGTVSPGDGNDQKGSVHFNVSNTSKNQKFKISLSGEYGVDDNQLSANDITQLAIQLTPDAPPLYNKDGSLNWAPNAEGISTWPGDMNPVAYLLQKYEAKTQNLVSNAVISYTVLPGLEIKGSFGFTNMQTNTITIIPFSARDPSTWSTSQRTSDFSNDDIQSWIMEPQATYTHKIARGYCRRY